MSDAGLIDAIAAAIAHALSAHGVTPTEGNATVQAQCARLCAEWGGDRHYLPKAWRAGRRAAVTAEIQQGRSIDQAARAAGIHPATARRITRRQPAGFGSDEWVI